MRQIKQGLFYLLLLPLFIFAFTWAVFTIVAHALYEVSKSLNDYLKSKESFIQRAVEITEDGDIRFPGGLTKTLLLIIAGWLVFLSLALVVHWLRIR